MNQEQRENVLIGLLINNHAELLALKHLIITKIGAPDKKEYDELLELYDKQREIYKSEITKQIIDSTLGSVNDIIKGL